MGGLEADGEFPVKAGVGEDLIKTTAEARGCPLLPIEENATTGQVKRPHSLHFHCILQEGEGAILSFVRTQHVPFVMHDVSR